MISVTKERIDSLTVLKENTAQYFSEIKKLKFLLEENMAINENVEKLEYLKWRIRFQLNKENIYEKKLIKQLDDLEKVLNIFIDFKKIKT